MTPLTKRVSRELRATATYRRGLIVSLDLDGIHFREKGRRTSLLLPFDHAFKRAAWLAANRNQLERILSRRGGR